MTLIADAVRTVLVPFLAVTGAVLFLLVGHVVVLRAVRELTFRRRQRSLALYRPIVDDALYGEDPEESLERLTRAPRPQLAIIASLLVEPLRIAEGTITVRARLAAAALGLLVRWETELGHRHWWIRAEAAHALGLMQYRSAVPQLVAALDDPYEEVRAAAVGALGHIAEPSAIPQLIARLAEQSRHQRVRVVGALHQFGSAVVPPLLDHARSHQGDLVMVAELLGRIGAVGALGSLLEWCKDDRADVRAAAVHAIGAIGVDERAYYHLLRTLNDAAAEVRAEAAWALGRSGRQDAAAYLVPRLQDQWIVAAQSARALRNLGLAGRRALESAAAEDGGDLARQMLWEYGAAPGA